jgi:hypothetical protein
MERDILGHARARFLPSPTGRGGTARPAHWRDILVGRRVPAVPHDLSACPVVANRNQLGWAGGSFGTPGTARPTHRRSILVGRRVPAVPHDLSACPVVANRNQLGWAGGIFRHAGAHVSPSPTGKGGTARPTHRRSILEGRRVLAVPHDLSSCLLGNISEPV